MEYIDLETDLEIRFESERLDMLQLGYLNLGMHRIMNRIALDMLIKEGWLTGSLPKLRLVKCNAFISPN